MKLNVNVTDGASPVLKKVIAMLSGPERTALNEQGGRASVVEAIAYHREYQAAGKWKGGGYLGSNGDSGRFGENIANGWHFRSATDGDAIIDNDAAYFRHKVLGGKILPTGGRKFLTIPLIAEARGMTARGYSDTYGKLFCVKGKRALFERVGGATTGARGRKNQAGASSIQRSTIRAVFALVRSVTHNPWPGAMPPSDRIATAFVLKYRQALTDILS